jgi:hypothetical protein
MRMERTITLERTTTMERKVTIIRREATMMKELIATTEAFQATGGGTPVICGAIAVIDTTGRVGRVITPEEGTTARSLVPPYPFVIP